MASSSSSRYRQSILCGPEDPSILYLQNEHRSREIWAGEETKPLRCRVHMNVIWDVPIPRQVINYVDRMGFGGLLRCGRPKDIDHHLITALVERWRPETHTFHFPVGEATVTLQDVEVLWGLKANGNAVTAHVPQQDDDYWNNLALEMLGLMPSKQELDKGSWKIKTLAEHIRLELGPNCEEYMYLQRARVYCLLLMGGLMFPNATGNQIPMFYTQFLVDPRQCYDYSWGSATLACLYKNLCEASCSQRNDVGGPLILLQLWAWERIPNIRPQMQIVNRQPYLPFASMWTGPSSVTKAPQHCTEHYRDQFSLMHDNQFIWMPYEERELPSACREGMACWTTQAYLIFWNTVEPHMPHRVLRQFGCSQPILDVVRFHTEGNLRRDRRGKSDRNWQEYHGQYIEMWNRKLDLTWGGWSEPTNHDQTEAYMNWFRRITVMYLTKPGTHPAEGFHEMGSSHSYAIETLHRLSHFMRSCDMSTQPDLYKAYQMVEDGLSICGEADLMDIQPSQRTTWDKEIPVRQKDRRKGKKATTDETSTRRDVNLADDCDEFETPPPPSQRHSVSHTNVGDSSQPMDHDFVTPSRHSVSISQMVVPDTPNPPSKYSKGNPFKFRRLFSRKN